MRHRCVSSCLGRPNSSRTCRCRSMMIIKRQERQRRQRTPTRLHRHPHRHHYHQTLQIAPSSNKTPSSGDFLLGPTQTLTCRGCRSTCLNFGRFFSHPRRTSQKPLNGPACPDHAQTLHASNIKYIAKAQSPSSDLFLSMYGYAR
jgi:hypothetical protein